MVLLPLWLNPAELMSEEAVELMCDADRRPRDAMPTAIVRCAK